MNRQLQVLVVALATLAAPATTAAQRPAPPSPPQRQVDSLAVEIRVLRARLDSVLAILRRLQERPAVAARDTTHPAGGGDDLAALRAAAAAATGRDTMQRPEETVPTQFVGRERNQAQLNPEISVTGDVRAYGTAPGVQRDNFDPREFEVGFQSALDPYSHTKIFVSLENGN